MDYDYDDSNRRLAHIEARLAGLQETARNIESYAKWTFFCAVIAAGGAIKNVDWKWEESLSSPWTLVFLGIMVLVGAIYLFVWIGDALSKRNQRKYREAKRKLGYDEDNT